MSEGFKGKIWRQSSDPIEPPAPVTKTIFPEIHAVRSFSFGATSSRPNKSEISILWRSIIFAFPEARSFREGMVLTETSLSSRYFTSSFRWFLFMLGMANKTSKGFVFDLIFLISVRSPKTFKS